MNRPKLNEPDVRATTTTAFIDNIKNETITITTTIPTKQFEKIFVPNGAYGTPESRYFENPTSPIPFDPTIEEVKQEWEDDDYTWEETETYICISKEYSIDDTLKCIYIYKQHKTYESFDGSDYEETSISLTLQEHFRLTKTFKALKWKV